MMDSIKLMKKDISLAFKTNKKVFLVFFYPICMSSLILTSDLTISIHIIMMAVAYAVYGIVVGLIATEEKTKSSMIFHSLPVKKRSIIFGKYLFTIAVILISTFLISIFPIIKSIIDRDISYVFFSILNSFIFSTVLFSIFFPFYYKLGYLKMQVINLIIFYGLIFIPIMINLLRNVELLKPIIKFVFDIVNMAIQNAATAFIGCIILYAISMVVSINLERND